MGITPVKKKSFHYRVQENTIIYLEGFFFNLKKVLPSNLLKSYGVGKPLSFVMYCYLRHPKLSSSFLSLGGLNTYSGV